MDRIRERFLEYRRVEDICLEFDRGTDELCRKIDRSGKLPSSYANELERREHRARALTSDLIFARHRVMHALCEAFDPETHAKYLRDHPEDAAQDGA